MLKNRVVRSLGTMSGTSLDGVDAAEILTDGHQIFGFGQSDYRPYSDAERGILQEALGKWQGNDVEAAAEIVETAHAQLLSQFDLHDVIGFHGQTVAHDPSQGRTHQIGDGRILAEVLQRPVIWDFRSADVELGGQGAPLAPFYHFALAKWLGETKPVAFLNLGGVGNITFVDPSKSTPDEADALLAFDTGPANAPINDLMVERLGLDFDDEGQLARTGQIQELIVERFIKHAYFYKLPPKSMDRNEFADLVEQMADLSDADAAATLTAICAVCVSEAIQHLPRPVTQIYVAGGGRKNKTIIEMIRASVEAEVVLVDDVGLDGDMLEAQAFAHLAVRVLNGLPTSCPSTTGGRAAICGGTLSMPSN